MKRILLLSMLTAAIMSCQSGRSFLAGGPKRIQKRLFLIGAVFFYVFFFFVKWLRDSG